MITLLLPAAVAIIVASLTLAFLRRPGRLPVNLPNRRSLHRGAIPRGGGVAIWAGWFAATIWLPHPQPWLGSVFALIGVSVCDDRFGVPAGVRLLVHAAAAAFWVWLTAPATGAIVAVLAVVWAANLYNFMDGSDGLAASMSLTGFAAYACGAWLAGAATTPILFALVAAVTPFFFCNLPPARMFLGDVGSVPMGFLAAAFGIEGIDAGLWPFWFPVLVFLPFIADATTTLARRLLRGERIWEAHRQHYYQRLVRLGFGHAGVLALYGALMVGTSTSALAALARSPGLGTTLLCVWTVVHVLTFVAIDYAWRRSDNGLHASKC